MLDIKLFTTAYTLPSSSSSPSRFGHGGGLLSKAQLSLRSLWAVGVLRHEFDVVCLPAALCEAFERLGAAVVPFEGATEGDFVSINARLKLHYLSTVRARRVVYVELDMLFVRHPAAFTRRVAGVVLVPITIQFVWGRGTRREARTRPRSTHTTATATK